MIKIVGYNSAFGLKHFCIFERQYEVSVVRIIKSLLEHYSDCDLSVHIIFSVLDPWLALD